MHAASALPHFCGHAPFEINSHLMIMEIYGCINFRLTENHILALSFPISPNETKIILPVLNSLVKTLTLATHRY